MIRPYCEVCFDIKSPVTIDIKYFIPIVTGGLISKRNFILTLSSQNDPQKLSFNSVYGVVIVLVV